VTRRAERRIVDLHGEEELRPPVLSYINRLSDALFLMARHENQKAGVEEENPSY
jgi:cob(I)alamin adenosyltransferase